MRDATYRILAEGQLLSNDSYATGLNNNDLVIGPSGAGKTRGYVKPNLLQCNGSLVVADTKGSLICEVGDVLRDSGYRVINLDFTDMLSSYGYNPLDYVRYDEKRRRYCQQDIMAIAGALVPLENERDPFWDQAAKLYLASLVGYVLECLPKREHSLEYVAKLLAEMGTDAKNSARGRKNCPVVEALFQELGEQDPDSFAYRTYQLYNVTAGAERMHASILGILAEKLGPLTDDGPLAMYRRPKRVELGSLGREKTAVFLTISDTDRSSDRLVDLFYTQAMQALCASADRDYPDHCLPVPVRFILDDFATNAKIPDFDNLIAVIRSRGIYVSVIIQSLSQLNALYGPERAKTIVNNCDNCLYLGGQDVETARYIGVKANRTADAILNMPLETAYLFTRGQKPRLVRKYDIHQHQRYRELPEAAFAAPAVREADPWTMER